MPDLSNADEMSAATQEAFIKWWAIATRQLDGPASALAAIRAAESTEEAVRLMMGYTIGPFQAGVVFALDVVADRANYPSGVGDD